MFLVYHEFQKGHSSKSRVGDRYKERDGMKDKDGGKREKRDRAREGGGKRPVGRKNQRKQLRAQDSWEGLWGRFDFGGQGAGHTGWSTKP